MARASDVSVLRGVAVGRDGTEVEVTGWRPRALQALLAVVLAEFADVPDLACRARAIDGHAASPLQPTARSADQLTALSSGGLDGMLGRYSLGYLSEGAHLPGVRDEG